VGKRSILFWLIVAYVTFITFWLVLRVLFFDRFWPLALLNTVAEYLFLPLPVFLLLGLVRRNWAALLALIIPTAALVVLFGELFLPHLARPIESNDEPLITVMSFNVLISNADYAAIARSIRAASPDLVGMQELSSTSAGAIATSLEDEYPHSTLKPLELGRGAGLLSRFPIETAEPFSLPPLNIALHATVNMEGRRIHVFVVHLSPNNFLEHPVAEYPALAMERYGRRAAEAVRLREEIAGLDEPFVLMCDCNLTDTSEAYGRLRGFMRDSFREAGWGFRHTLNIPTVPFPVQRLDYVWHSDKFVAVDAFVGQAGGSDHLPAVAKFRLVKAP
jgi:vancomycin resistance protein VanJ